MNGEISRQRKHQVLNREKGLCMRCSNKPSDLCPKHTLAKIKSDNTKYFRESVKQEVLKVLDEISQAGRSTEDSFINLNVVVAMEGKINEIRNRYLGSHRA